MFIEEGWLRECFITLGALQPRLLLNNLFQVMLLTDMFLQVVHSRALFTTIRTDLRLVSFVYECMAL